MSFEAQQWAVKQRCGNLARKALLMILANVADGDGFVKQIRLDYLEWTTELSRTQIYRRMRELEDGGALTRERGHHFDGRMVSAKLNLEASFALDDGGRPESEKQSPAEGTELSPAGGTHLDEQSPAEGTELSPPGGTPPYCRDIYNKTSTTTLESPSPLRARRDNQASEPPEGPKEAFEGEDAEGSEPRSPTAEARERFQEFLRAYPVDATMDFDGAERLFLGLSIKDRLKAIRFAKLYASGLKSRGKTQPRDIAGWLRTRQFDKLEAALDAKARSIGLPKSQVFVVRGTDAWKAWVRLKGREPPTTSHCGKTGWWFDTLFPTGPPAQTRVAEWEGVEF